MTKTFLYSALFLFLLVRPGLFSQNQNQNQEDLRKKFLDDSVKIAASKPIRFQVRLETRASKFEGEKINIYGYDAGILVKNKLRIALGYSSINAALSEEKTRSGVSATSFLNVKCAQLNTELIYHDYRFVALGFPMEIGAGRYKLDYIPVNDSVAVSRKEGFLAFANFGLSGTFKPIRWLGMKGIVGYRKTAYPPEKEFNFSAAFFSIGLNLDLQEIVKDIKMYRLKKSYSKDFKALETFVDILTD